MGKQITMDPHEQKLADKISIQGFFCKICAQTGTVSVFSNKALYLRFG